MRTIVRHAIVSSVVASGIAMLSCEAIVPDTVPEFTCEGTSLAACPVGEYCNGSGCKKCEAQDVCDHLDNDCNGKVDDGKLCDADGDGYTWCGQLDANGKPFNVDCDDNDPTVYPGAPEICDGKDNNCNGLIDDGATCPTEGAVCIDGKCVTNPCDPDAGTGCQANQHCDATSHTCISNTTLPIGSPCSANAECTSPLFCADSTVVGTTVLPQVGKGVCTQPCCASSDCPQSFVCYDSGTGGRYCVDPTTLGRSGLGTEQGGTSETSATRCRSGVLANDNQHCGDTCCSDANCAQGTACALDTMDNHDGLYCTAKTGSGGQWADCSSSGASQCHDSACVEFAPFLDRCVTACCSTSSCGTLDGLPASCYYLATSNNDYVPLCTDTQPGSSPLGATCSSNDDCQSGVCYTDTNTSEQYCSDACCVDSDCGSGWICRPSPTLPRCIKN